MQNGQDIPQRSGSFTSILIVGVLILFVLTIMAGLPPQDQIPGYTIGIVVLLIIAGVIALIGWHLLLRPLPDGTTVTGQSLLTTQARQNIALFLTLGTLSIGIGGVWDEIWHAKTGIAIGQDLLWLPHLLLYAGLLTLVFAGGWSWRVLMMRGTGTLQQRFRANSLLGITFIGGLFSIYAGVADPLWHRFYGMDIASWSLPHLLLVLVALLMGLLSITYHKSLMPPQQWQMAFRFNPRNLLILLVMVGVLLEYMPIFTIQWYSTAITASHLNWNTTYPNWTLAVFIALVATLLGTIVLHATRLIGSATLLGLLTLVTRFLLDKAISSPQVGTSSIWLIMPIMLALDISYWVTLRRTQKPPVFWVMAVVNAFVFALGVVPLIDVMFPFLVIDATNAPSMLLGAILASAGGVWLGNPLGEVREYGSETVTAESATRPNWIINLVYVVYALLLIFLIATGASPS